jgi:hypothetical protein
MGGNMTASVKKTKSNLPGPGPGRPKGIPNKTTRTAKEAIAAAAEALGGAERLTAWALEDPSNERVFWGSIYPKLLPLQVQGDAQNPISLLLMNMKPSALPVAEDDGD